jgi:homoserine O-acetyltransferase/O-succinyltransferase
LPWQRQAPTRAAADNFYAERLKAQLARTDANDMLYQFDASREYNPAPKLESIKAPLVAINSADDLINPPELGIMEREIKRVQRGRYILIPISPETRGHGTHSLPAIWQQYLRELLAAS